MKNPLVSILIVNWRNVDYTLRCIKSILNSSFRDFEILVVDNDSGDNSLDELSKVEGIRVYNSGGDIGFSAANNFILKYVNSKYVFFCGQDTELDKDCLKNLVRSAEENPSCGMFSPLVYELENKNKLQQTGLKMDFFGYPYPLVGKRSLDELNQNEIMYLPGCSMFIRKDVLDEVGSFDSNYFIFAEDLDLGWRVQIAGHRLMVVYDSKIYHKGGVATGKEGVKRSEVGLFKRYLSERNMLRTIFKNYQWYTLLFVLPVQFYLNLIESAVYLFLWKPKASFVYLKSWYWNLKNFDSIVGERRKIKKYRKKTDFDLYKKMYLGSGKIFTIMRDGLGKIQLKTV